MTRTFDRGAPQRCRFSTEHPPAAAPGDSELPLSKQHPHPWRNRRAYRAVAPCAAARSRRDRRRAEATAAAQPPRSASPAPCAALQSVGPEPRPARHGVGELLGATTASATTPSSRSARPCCRRASSAAPASITADGLAPLRFSEQEPHRRSGALRARPGQVCFSSNRPERRCCPGAQDRLSVLLQLGALIAGDRQVSAPARRSHPDREHARGRTGSSRWKARNSSQLPGGSVARAQAHAQPAQDSTSKWSSGWLPAWITSRCACV